MGRFLDRMSQISSGTLARGIVLLIALVNMVLVFLGKAPFKLDENVIYDFCSAGGVIITAVLGYWKNNSYSKAALAGDDKMKASKLGLSDSEFDIRDGIGLDCDEFHDEEEF